MQLKTKKVICTSGPSHYPWRQKYQQIVYLVTEKLLWVCRWEENWIVQDCSQFRYPVHYIYI